MSKQIIPAVITVVLFLSTLGLFAGLVYVGPHEALVLVAKFGGNKPPDRVLAEAGERGIRREVLGVGYHWILPVIYEYERVPVVVIPPNKIGVATALDGIKPEGNRFLAEDGEIGIRRKVLGPGTYRLNPRHFKISLEDQTIIETGTVGVLVDRQAGGVVKTRVLQPGVHYLNPRQYKVEIVNIGLNEYTLTSGKRVAIDERMLRGEVAANSQAQNMLMQKGVRRTASSRVGSDSDDMVSGGAVTFPSKDGFTVGIDVTVLWELTPQRAVQAVDTYGTDDILVERVIHPKLNSASRNEGSKYSAKKMIQGSTRADFKVSFTATLLEYTRDSPLDVLMALPRRVFVPVKIQLPIMQAQLNNEELLTNLEIQETSKVQALLEEQIKLVDQEIEQVRADTRVLRLSVQAEAEKEVAEFEAGTRLEVARVDLEVQKLVTAIEDIRSTAKAEVIRLRAEKKANLLARQVDAFGGADAFNAYIFASRALPDDKLPVRIIHAGEGTFWTDLKSASPIPDLLSLQRFQKELESGAETNLNTTP